MAFCERQQKQFAIRKPLFVRTFCAPCTSASVERVFNNGGYLLGHKDASKAQCIDCGKLLSLDSNKPGKQTVHGLKCYLEKMPQRYLSIHCTTWGKWNHVNNDHLQKRRNWTRYWQHIAGLTWWLNVWKISPVEDWRSTSLEWPWPWFRPYGIPSCISHRPLLTYQISLRSEENFFQKSPLRFWSSSESRDTKTRTNIKNPARSNLDIVL